MSSTRTYFGTFTILILSFVGLYQQNKTPPVPKNGQYSRDTKHIMTEEDVWITVDSSIAKEMFSSSSRLLVPNGRTVLQKGNASLIRVNTDMLPSISQFVHQNIAHCGGMVEHDNYGDASRYLSRRILGDRSFFRAPSIDNWSVAYRLLRRVDYNKMLRFNKRLLTNFKTRYFSNLGGIQSAQWIKSEWEQIVSSRDDIHVRYYEHDGLSSCTLKKCQNSIIVTIEGSDKGKDVVIIGAHLDSINNHGGNNIAPGADDNGSGLSVLTETLRVIVNAGYRPRKTIEIIGFAAEEVDGLQGSKDIASHYKTCNKNVISMLNFDMVGYKGKGKDIYISTDFSNNALSRFLANLLDIYLPYLSHGFMRCKYECSDHAMFYMNDFPASMGTEMKSNTDPDTFNPNYHSENDTYVDGPHMSNFARLAVIYVAELAK